MIDIKTHHTRHESGGADEINVAGLSGVLADAQVPQVHGNAYHSPEMLATDGSVTMKGNFIGDSQAPIYKLGRFYSELSPIADDYFFIPQTTNYIAFNDLRGGSTSFNTAPFYGSADYLYQPTGECSWHDTDGQVVITTTFWASTAHLTWAGVTIRSRGLPLEVKVEVYDSTSATWITIVDVTNPANETIIGRTPYNGDTYTQVRVTITPSSSTGNYYTVALIYVLNSGSTIYDYLPNKEGYAMYGDIDMNSHSLNNPPQVQFVNVASEPAAPSSGGILYVYGGALKYIGSSGTRTTIANA